MISFATGSPSAALLARVFAEPSIAPPARAGGHPAHSAPLPSRLSTGALAWACVRAAALMAGIDRLPDPDRIAVAYRSDRVLCIGGAAPEVWSPYSGFFRTSDGWVRTHGNYPHHAAGLLTALALPVAANTETVAAVLTTLSTEEAVRRIVATQGLAVAVRPEDPARDARLRRSPLLGVTRIDHRTDARTSGAPHSLPSRPLAGVRVLDLTRVIAGPVCTRTLALLGADVLRVDPPHLAEPEWQHFDTGHGKRSTRIDARSARFTELLNEADVVVLGYRPASLDRLGLSAPALAERRPGIVVAELSAWGDEEPDRAGFDSLVQAESGISLIESPDGVRPGALPAQALDHSAGYLLAAAIVAVRARRLREGGSWSVHTSLRRVAAELLGMPRAERPGEERDVDTTDHVATFDVDGTAVTTARPALPDVEFSAPRRWGADQPRW